MLDAAGAALTAFLDPSMLAMLVAGTLAGLVIGLLPGLGGTAAVAILLPFVFTLEPQQALALIIGAVATVHTSDTITAVLLGVPGSASATVTMMDGHAMARQGQAARALSLAFLSSMAGGLLGAVGLTFSIPIARPLVLAFGAPELFMLTLLGISLTALLSQGNMLKGLVAGMLGVLLGCVGAAPATAEYRYTFGSLFLADGLDLVAVALGLFGLAEIAHLIARKTSIASRVEVGGGWAEGARDFLTHWRLVLRGALVGIWAGVLPGIGATAGTWMAYGQTVATAKDREKFGKGDPRGIVAPESANNSVEAGDLIPTLLFGIPGGAPAALLLGALLLYGIQPGPRLVTDHLDIIYTIVWSFALASVLGAACCALLSRPLARLTTIRFPLLAPLLIVLMLLSSYQSSQQYGDLLVMVVLGVIGFALKQAGFPRAPLLIGFVLSIPLERYYFLTVNLYTAGEWTRRPWVLVMAVILVAPLVGMAVRRWRGRREPAATPAAAGPPRDAGPVATLTGERDEPGDDTGGLERSLWPLLIGVAALVVLVAALVAAQGYGAQARLVPNLAGGVGVALTLGLLAGELRARRRGQERAPSWNPDMTRTAVAFGWIVLYLVLVYFLGYAVAAAVFLPLFLWRVAGVRPLHNALYTTVVVVALLVLYATGNLEMPMGVFVPALPVLV